MSVNLMLKLRDHPAYPYVVRLLLIGIAMILIFQATRMWHTMEYRSPGTDDFIEYWSAGQVLLEGKNPYNFDELYDLQVSLGSRYESPIIMWNPPWLLVWILPLLRLPFEAAAFVWLLINVVLTLFCGTIVWRTLAPARVQERIGTAWIATVFFVPALFTVRMGQMSTLLLVGVVGFLYSIKRNKPFLAGLFLALTTIKPHVLYLLWIAVVWWVVVKREWRLVAGVCVVMVASLAVLTVISPAWITQYRQAIKQPPLYWASPTAGTLLRLFVFSDWSGAQFLPPIVVGLSFTGYLLTRRPQFDWRTAVSPLLLVSVPTAAYGWTFDQIVLLVPYLEIVSVLLGEELQAKRHRKRLIVTSLLLIGSIMVIENQLQLNEFFFFWVPWAVGAVYVYTQAIRHSVDGPLLPEMAR